MKIKAAVSEYREVEVNPWDAWAMLKKEVLAAEGIRSDAYVDNRNRIVAEDEYHTSHSWTETVVVIAEPTKEQIDLVNAFTHISRALAKVNT